MLCVIILRHFMKLCAVYLDCAQYMRMLYMSIHVLMTCDDVI